MDPQRCCAPLRGSRLDRLPPTSNSWRTSCCPGHDRADRPPPQEALWQPDRDLCAADCLGAGWKRKKAVTGSLAKIIIPPNFRPATALLDCEKKTLRWPGPFGSGFLSPQPPGAVRIGPVRSNLSPYWANESWSFFFLGLSFRARASANPESRCSKFRIFGSPPRRVSRMTSVDCGVSAATCRPRLTSHPVCRGCRPGHRPPRHQRPRGKYFPAARSSCRHCHSSHRP